MYFNIFQACRTILEQIIVIKVKNISQLVMFLNNMRNTLSGRNTTLCRLIIIDSIPVLYFPFIGGANAEGKLVHTCVYN